MAAPPPSLPHADVHQSLRRWFDAAVAICVTVALAAYSVPVLVRERERARECECTFWGLGFSWAPSLERRRFEISRMYVGAACHP